MASWHQRPGTKGGGPWTNTLTDRQLQEEEDRKERGFSGEKFTKLSPTWRQQMATYNIALVEGTLKIGFGSPAQNDQIVRDVETRLAEMVTASELVGGDVLRVNGPASLPVAMVIAHAVCHLYGAVACFDPKLAKYVVAISHNPSYTIGDLID